MKAEIYNKIEKNLNKKLRILPEYVYDFIFSIQNKQIGTRLEYTKDLGIFLDYIGEIKSKNAGDITIEDISTLSERDIWNFLSYLTCYKKTFYSKNGKEVIQTFSNNDLGKSRKMATIHKFFSFLLDKDLIKKDVSRKVDVTVHKTKKIKDRLDFDDLEKFYSTIIDDLNIDNHRLLQFHKKTKFRDYIIVLILSYTGIRISELVQLNIDEISIDKKSMIVVRKGGNQEKIPIPERILEDLHSYIIQRKAITGLEGDSKDALFLSLQKKRINPKTIRNMLEKIRLRAGIDIKITPHTFRRTFGTKHYNTYRDMYLTAKIMGHSSAETTRKFYADPNDERVINSMKVFDYEPQSSNNTDDELKDILTKLKKLSNKTGVSINELLKSV